MGSGGGGACEGESGWWEVKGGVVWEGCGRYGGCVGGGIAFCGEIGGGYCGNLLGTSLKN